MPQTQTTARVEEEALNINPTLLALRPRQVSLLIINSTKMPSAAANTQSAPKPDPKTLLLHSIALYLQRSGYSKTFKKLRSESDLQIDDKEGSGFDLEDIFSKFLETRDQGSKKLETIACKEKISAEAEKPAENGTEIKGKESGASFQFVATAEPEKDKKSKKKKSKKLALDNGESVSEDKKKVDSKMDVDNDVAEKEVKKQKKKSQNLISTNAEEDAVKVSETAVDAENQDKDSKKRKRSSSQEIATEPTDAVKPVEKSKRQKTEAAETQTLESNGQVSEDDALASEKKEQKAKKSTKKQQNGSSEPTTAQRFQRVKADEVVFSDERLKDNSYWAKDGAESGYGAKAQEVLGQVKGKGFRHEKTKKKRGSYRGGQIDLHTHSVKFNYSDEE